MFVYCHFQLPRLCSGRAYQRSGWPMLESPQPVWEEQMPLCAHSGSQESWLASKVSADDLERLGCVGGQMLKKSPGRLPCRGCTGFQNGSADWGKRLCVAFSLHTPSFFPACLHINSLSRSWEKSSQRSPFVLWQPISHTNEACLKINSLDFDLCWVFQLFFQVAESFLWRNINLTPNT